MPPPPGSGLGWGSRLTLSLLAGGLVEGEAQRDDGGDLQDDEGDVLKGLPHQLQEGLGLLWGDEVLAEHRGALL